MERREEGGRDAEQLALLGSPDATSDWTDEAALPASLSRITNASHDFSFLRGEREVEPRAAGRVKVRLAKKSAKPRHR